MTAAAARVGELLAERRRSDGVTAAGRTWPGRADHRHDPARRSPRDGAPVHRGAGARRWCARWTRPGSRSSRSPTATGSAARRSTTASRRGRRHRAGRRRGRRGARGRRSPCCCCPGSARSTTCGAAADARRDGRADRDALHRGRRLAPALRAPRASSGMETVGFLMLAHLIEPGASGRAGADHGRRRRQCVYVVDSAGALVLGGRARAGRRRSSHEIGGRGRRSASTGTRTCRSASPTRCSPTRPARARSTARCARSVPARATRRPRCSPRRSTASASRPASTCTARAGRRRGGGAARSCRGCR